MPGWFVTGTDTGVGKTVIAGALAMLVREQGRRVGAFKPVATGCRRDVRLGEGWSVGGWFIDRPVRRRVRARGWRSLPQAGHQPGVSRAG